jgi:hypothetical protein
VAGLLAFDRSNEICRIYYSSTELFIDTVFETQNIADICMYSANSEKDTFRGEYLGLTTAPERVLAGRTLAPF